MSRAPLSTDLSPFTGRPRLRCTGCGKVAYATEALAEAAADTINRTQDVRMKVYMGSGCGWFHLSRIERDGSATFHAHQEDIMR